MSDKERRKKLNSVIFKMTILVTATYLMSYAWFYKADMSSFAGLTSTTEAVNEINISLNGGTSWENIANWSIASGYTFKMPITGNGVDLYSAVTFNESGIPTYMAPAQEEKDYYEFEVRFDSDLDTVIFLDEESYVVPNCGTLSSELIGESVDNKSLYGDFSKDIIAGAVRVAFIENDIVAETHTPQSVTKMVWAPNPKYELINNAGVYSVNINSTNTQSYNYYNVSDPTTWSESRVSNIKDNLNATYYSKDAGGDPPLLVLSGGEIKSLTIRIWVEGNDRETLKVLKGGLFKVGFKFVGISKQFDTIPPNVTADLINNELIGFQSGMEYSIDYGNNWIKYTNSPNPTLENVDVYVRKSETDTHFASDYVELNF